MPRELIYVGSDDGYLYCYDDAGQLKWKFSAGSPIESSPAVDKNGNIYFGADNGNVYALFSDGALQMGIPDRRPGALISRHRPEQYDLCGFG